MVTPLTLVRVEAAVPVGCCTKPMSILVLALSLSLLEALGQRHLQVTLLALVEQPLG